MQNNYSIDIATLQCRNLSDSYYLCKLYYANCTIVQYGLHLKLLLRQLAVVEFENILWYVL